MSNAAQTLLQEIDRLREIGYPESNLVSNNLILLGSIFLFMDTMCSMIDEFSEPFRTV